MSSFTNAFTHKYIRGSFVGQLLFYYLQLTYPEKCSLQEKSSLPTSVWGAVYTRGVQTLGSGLGGWMLKVNSCRGFMGWMLPAGFDIWKRRLRKPVGIKRWTWLQFQWIILLSSSKLTFLHDNFKPPHGYMPEKLASLLIFEAPVLGPWAPRLSEILLWKTY